MCKVRIIIGLSYGVIVKILCNDEHKRLSTEPDVEKALNKYKHSNCGNIWNMQKRQKKSHL